MMTTMTLIHLLLLLMLLPVQVNRLMHDKGQLEKILCGDGSTAQEGLVHSLKTAIDVIKSRQSSPTFQPEEMQVLVKISSYVDDLVKLSGGGINNQHHHPRCS